MARKTICGKSEIKKKIKQEPGKCPVCGSYAIEYGSTQLEGDNLGYEFSCKCGAYGIEWYALEYAETLVKGKDKDMQPC
jgi:hypothetical protein